MRWKNSPVLRRPLLFWLLIALAAGLATWWTLYCPYRPELLFRALPAQTAYVGVHRDLAGRWDELRRNPLTRALLLAMGLEPDEVARDPVARTWLEKLGSDEVVVAYVPALGSGAEPAWILATWLGGKSQRLRWNLKWVRTQDLIAHPPRRGWRSWTVAEEATEEGPHLTFALVEGMAVGVFSRNPALLNEVLDTLDGLKPSLSDRPEFAVWDGIGRHGTHAPDRGWFSPSALWGGATSPVGTVAFEWTDLGSDRLAGRLVSRDPFGADLAGASPGKIAGLDRWLGDLPQSLLLLSPDLLLPRLEMADRPLWMKLIAEPARMEKAGIVAIALLGDEYSGRLKGIKLPTIVAALPVEQEARVWTWFRSALDRLNARYRWGLVPRDLAVGTGRVTVLEATSTNFLATLPPEECPACVLRGGWWLWASNAEGLSRLVSRFEAQAAGAPASATWMDDLAGSPPPAYLWLDLARAGKTLRLAISTYSLKLLLEDPRGTQETRQQLNEAKAWIDSLLPLSRARFWLRSDGGRLEASFKLGP